MRKPRAIRLLTVVLAVLLSGCSEVRYYPYCVFGPDPKISSQNELHKRIVQFVQGVVGNESRIEISPNDRYVTVEAFQHEHEALSRAWSRVACIGQTRYDVEYGQYKACIYMIDAALQRSGIPPLGKWSDGIRKVDTVYCGQPVDRPSSAVPATRLPPAKSK
jgi:hypothetical protein